MPVSLPALDSQVVDAAHLLVSARCPVSWPHPLPESPQAAVMRCCLPLCPPPTPQLAATTCWLTPCAPAACCAPLPRPLAARCARLTMALSSPGHFNSGSSNNGRQQRAPAPVPSLAASAPSLRFRPPTGGAQACFPHLTHPSPALLGCLLLAHAGAGLPLMWAHPPPSAGPCCCTPVIISVQCDP
jgi:hypothetical protein